MSDSTVFIANGKAVMKDSMDKRVCPICKQSLFQKINSNYFTWHSSIACFREYPRIIFHASCVDEVGCMKALRIAKRKTRKLHRSW